MQRKFCRVQQVIEMPRKRLSRDAADSARALDRALKSGEEDARAKFFVSDYDRVAKSQSSGKDLIGEKRERLSLRRRRGTHLAEHLVDSPNATDRYLHVSVIAFETGSNLCHIACRVPHRFRDIALAVP